jgi:glycine hydroxymethyltransferase
MISAEPIKDMEQARDLLKTATPKNIAQQIDLLAKKNDKWRSKCINLHAGEDAMSPTAMRILTSDLCRRGIIGETGHKYHKGARYLDQIESLLLELGKKLFNAQYFESRPVTASTAESIPMHCLANVGDTILTLQAPRGHPTWNTPSGWGGMRGCKMVDIPFDHKEWNIDVDGLAKAANKVKKSPLMIIGTSVFLFQHPYREVKKIADEIGARVWLDAAQVLGLIASGMWRNPLEEGVDLITGAASKTLSGPMGGVIFHNDPELDKKISQVFWGHFASLGHARMAALAVTMAEWMAFGKEYGSQICSNAKTLASALDKEGFDVCAKHKGYTESHAVAVNVTKEGGGNVVADKLDRANIVVSAIRLYNASEDYQTARGLRLGVAEMTRYGMREPEMWRIAKLMRRVAIENEDPSKVGREAASFREPFDRVHYCFENP